tara:strand:- start:193 stop:1158 length:966 start_codon:yes stop_codon:yes gene_type:complete
MKNKIIIVSGDPNSINSEIIFKSWNKLNSSLKKRIYIISNYNLLKKQQKKMKKKIKIIKVNNINEGVSSKYFKILNIDLKFSDPFNVKAKEASKFVISSLNTAHSLAQNKRVSGIINCAINKTLLKKQKIGVTEYLASRSDIKKNSEVMLIHSKDLSVSPLTTHIDINQVSKKINKRLIITKVKTLNNGFKKLFNRKPKIGVLGLNPHNAELRKKSEEIKIIIPAINKLKNLGINVSGPLVSDTVFINNYKKFDVIIGMYHDQVLAPFKALKKFEAINVTLGLRYLRVSPDHGIAAELIGKNKADPTSLLKCIEFMNINKK